MTDAWEQIESFNDELSAEVLAGELRGEGVPAEVVNQTHLPGPDNSVVVRVPASLAHRARWVMKSLKPTSAELVYAATGELSGKE